MTRKSGHSFHVKSTQHFEPARRDYQPHNPPAIESKLLKEKRKLRVYLPHGYAQHPDRRYPVLYCQDGQNMFEHGAYGSWKAHETLDRLSARGEIQDVIVVGVDHGPGRMQDYIAPEDGGRADLYARFLVEELKPHIDSTYRTKPEAEHTAILGSSLGAVAALYTAWNHSGVFGKVASLSGSWWLRRWREHLGTHTKRPLRLYLDSGDSGHANDCVHHTQALRQTLVGMGYKPDEELHHRIGRRQTHTESAWGDRLQHALRFLFPPGTEQVA
jgi:enterochelin esterase-like enzyme